MSAVRQSQLNHLNTNTDAYNLGTERWVLIASIIVSSMAFIDQGVLSVALPSLQQALNATGSDLLWIVNGYTLMLASFILVGGSLGDKLGRKRIFMVGVSIFTIASIAAGFAPSAPVLIWSRVVQGIGGALMVPGSLALITAVIPPERRGAAIGTWSSVTTIFFLIGPAIGGILADAGLWRAVFFINVPLAAVALVILSLFVPESYDPNASAKFDIPGVVLATVGLAGIAYGFTAAPDYGFADPRIYGTLSIGVLSLAAFVYVESTSNHPMMSLHLFKSKTFSGTNLLTLFLYGALSAWMFFFSLNMIQVQGYPGTFAGVAFIPFSLILAGMSHWSGSLVDKVGPKLPLIIGPAIVGVGFAYFGLIGLTAGTSAYWTTFFPGVVLAGIGMGITVAPLTTAVMGSVSSDHAGTASGVNNAVSRVAGVLAVAILGSLVLFSFSSAITTRTAEYNLPAEVMADIRAEAANLGDADVPASVPAEYVDGVEQALKLSFVDTFQLVMFINAALAFLSAGMAAVLVENKLVEMQDNE